MGPSTGRGLETRAELSIEADTLMNADGSGNRRELRKAGAGDELEVPAVVRDRLPLRFGEYHPRARPLD